MFHLLYYLYFIMLLCHIYRMKIPWVSLKKHSNYARYSHMSNYHETEGWIEANWNISIVFLMRIFKENATEMHRKTLYAFHQWWSQLRNQRLSPSGSPFTFLNQEGGSWEGGSYMYRCTKGCGYCRFCWCSHSKVNDSMEGTSSLPVQSKNVHSTFGRFALLPASS